MHLGLVIYGDINQTTGGYLYDQKLVEYLRAAGDKVDIISLPDRGYFQNVFPRGLHKTHMRLLNTNFDALILDELCHPSLSLWLPGLRKAQCCIGLIHHLKYSEPQTQISKTTSHLLEKSFLNMQHGLICNSETTQQTCKQLMSSQRPSLVAPPGPITSVDSISATEISTRAHASGPLRILFLGTLTKRKGLHTLIEALNAIETPMQCTVVGSDQRDKVYANSCRNLISSSTPHDVDFVGEVTAHLLLEYLQAAHLLVVPSEYEGFGMAYLEGLSAGLPAIATTQGAPAEFIIHGHNGYLLDPSQPHTLKMHLQMLHGDRNLLAKMGIAARQTFERHPCWEESFTAARSFIEQMATTKCAGAMPPILDMPAPQR